MTQKEFEQLSRRLVDPGDYVYIENLYMAAGNMDKQTFCIEMRKMCAYDVATDQIELRTILHEVGRKVGALEAELSFRKKQRDEESYELARFLINKACVYNDTDLYKQAVKLVGRQSVICLKIEMNLPLWNEDKDYIKYNLP